MGANNRLHGRRLFVARAVWAGLAMLTLALFSAGIPARLTQLLTICNGGQCELVQLASVEAEALQRQGIPLQTYALFFVLLESSFALVFTAAGLLIVWRKSDDWLGLFTSLTLVTFGAIIPPPLRTLLDTGGVGLRLAVYVIQIMGWSSFLSFFYLFPNGQFVPRWTRWRPVLFAAWAVAWLLFPIANIFSWPLPLALLVLLGWFTSGVIAQVYRYLRVSSPEQRQQTKWVVFGFAAATLGIAAFVVPLLLVPALRQPGPARVLYHLIGVPFFSLALLSIPVSIVIAILRYRLWELDIIIRRTLVYTGLTAALALIYFSSVVLLQASFAAAGAQRSTIAIVLSTLAIAALFAPLRRRLQEVIDRRFYRHKYDAAQILAAFSATLIEETDLEQLNRRLVAVVQETMQPTQASLWLIQPDAGNSSVNLKT
jgi:hypothetical protein